MQGGSRPGHGDRAGMSGHDRRSQARGPRSTRVKLTYTLLVLAGLGALLELSARAFTDATEFERFGQRVGSWMDTGLDDFNACLLPDPELFWRLAPDRRLPLDRERPFFGQVTNAAGLRGRLPGVRDPDALVVLALGDSCTFGFGAAADETWPAQLEARLVERLQRPVEVFNAGVPGYSSAQGVIVAERWIPRLEPDVVVVAFGWNDSSVWDGRSDAEHRDGAAGPGALLEHSRAFAVLRKALFSWRRSSGGRRAVQARVPPEVFAANLARIAELAGDAGAAVGFLAWPFRDQMGAAGVELTEYQQVSLSAPGPSVDLRAGFRALGFAAEDFLDGGHVGPQGYGLVATLVAAGLPWAAVPPWPHDG